MKIDDIISICNKHNGYLYSEIMKQYNIPTIYITRLVEKNKLFKVARGIYITDQGIEDEFYITSLIYSKIVFSGESSLFLNNLSNKQTINNEVTIKYGSTAPKINNYKVITCRKESFEIGITMVNTPFGNQVRCYDKERTICDLFLRPNNYDYEDRIFAINEYKNKYLNLKKLYEYAKKLNVYNEVKNVFEVISWN